MLSLLVVAVALTVAIVVIGAPIYKAFGGSPDAEGSDSTAEVREPQSIELEAERDAKLREIRDAELDWRTGKLSESDWRVLDARLRAEAAELLKAGDSDDTAPGESRPGGRGPDSPGPGEDRPAPTASPAG